MIQSKVLETKKILNKWKCNSTTYQTHIKGTKKDHTNNEGMLYKLFKYLYAPFLMKKWIRASVVIIFFGWLCSSVAVIPKIGKSFF